MGAGAIGRAGMSGPSPEGEGNAPWRAGEGPPGVDGLRGGLYQPDAFPCAATAATAASTAA